MPPCAAMECDRRGESSNVMALTAYPCWASVAAAEAPASPVPTTTMVIFRRFAGLTRDISSRVLDQRDSSGVELL